MILDVPKSMEGRSFSEFITDSQPMPGLEVPGTVCGFHSVHRMSLPGLVQRDDGRSQELERIVRLRCGAEGSFGGC